MNPSRMASFKRKLPNTQRQEDIQRVTGTLKEWILQGKLEKINVYKEVAKIFSLCEKTVRKYADADPATLVTPSKKRNKKCPVREQVDNFWRAAISRVINNMHSNGRNVTLSTVHEELKSNESIGFCGSLSTLSKLLHEIGFQYKKENKRKVLMEKPEIAYLRFKFLKEYKQYQDLGYNFVFLDETWFYSKGFSTKLWQDENFVSKHASLSEGIRYIIIHAGTKDGFIKDAGLAFSSKGTNDYHGSVTAQLFETWLKDKVLPQLESSSVIIMDNASYHSVVVEKHPTSQWTKNQLQQWLTKHNTTFPEKCYNKELLQIAQQLNVPKRYVIDEIVQEQGHMVLRLPPYHCHYNPIEHVWSEAKRAFASRGRTIAKFNREAVLKLWQEVLDSISPEKWRNYVRHCEKLIDNDWNNEERYERGQVDDIIIAITDDEDSEEDILALPLNQHSSDENL